MQGVRGKQARRMGSKDPSCAAAAYFRSWQAHGQVVRPIEQLGQPCSLSAWKIGSFRKAKPRARFPLGVCTSACQAQHDYPRPRTGSQGYL